MYKLHLFFSLIMYCQLRIKGDIIRVAMETDNCVRVFKFACVGR